MSIASEVNKNLPIRTKNMQCHSPNYEEDVNLFSNVNLSLQNIVSFWTLIYHFKISCFFFSDQEVLPEMGDGRHILHGHVQHNRRHEQKTHQRERFGGRPGVPHRVFAEPLRRPLHAQRWRHHHRQVHGRLQNRLRCARQWTRHRLRLHAHFWRQVQHAGWGRARGYQHRHQRGRHWRPAQRDWGGHSGDHGELWTRVRRKVVPHQTHPEPKRPLHRALPWVCFPIFGN